MHNGKPKKTPRPMEPVEQRNICRQYRRGCFSLADLGCLFDRNIETIRQALIRGKVTIRPPYQHIKTSRNQGVKKSKKKAPAKAAA